MAWLALALIIFIFQIATILIVEYRHPSKTVAWLLILFCFPVIGFAVYYFVAQDYKNRRKVRKKGTHLFRKRKKSIWQNSSIITRPFQSNNSELRKESRLFRLLSHLSESPISGCNDTVVLTNGEATYEAMFKAMEKAEHHIHLEFYIFRGDRIGTQFQQLLLKKAREGVKVRIIVDGLGSYGLNARFVKPLRDSGIEFHSFLPPLFALYHRKVNFRNHRKILVVDGKIGFVGGINIGDEYLGKDKKLGFWRDTQIQVQGDAVYFLQNTFINDWFVVSNKELDDPELYPKHVCQGSEQVQMIASGPDSRWDAIQEMFFGAISVGKQRIYIQTPYFIPDLSIFTALKTAAVSKVDVRVIIPGVNDSKLVNLATLSYVEELMQAGVRFYQYQKGFMHAKVVIVDQMLASVGTANMDMRSLFSNFELNAVLFERSTIERLYADFEQDLKDSKEIILKEFEQRSRTQKIKEMLARMLSPLL